MKKLIATAAITTALGAGVFGVSALAPAGAQDDGTTTTTAPADEARVRDREWLRDHPRARHIIRGTIGIAAETIGIEPEELVEEIRAGKTVAEVAEANGVDPQAVIDAIVEEAMTHVTERAEHFVSETRAPR